MNQFQNCGVQTMTEYIYKELKNYAGTDKLISIYDDIDDVNSFYLGFIIDIDDDFVLIDAVDTRGLEDGFKLIGLSDVFLIQNDIMYSEKMMKLFKLKNQEKDTIDVIKNNVFLSLLKKAYEESLLVEINEDENYIGYVKEYKTGLKIDVISEYGDDIGPTYIDSENINFIECKSRHLRDIELLYGKNKIKIIK